MIKVFYLAFLLLSIAVAQETSTSTIVTLKCKQVQTSVCESGFQYTIDGKNENIVLNQSICLSPGQKCRPTQARFDVQKCLIDYTNKKCSTQICYVVPQRQVCLKNRPSCSIGTFESFNCLTCQKTAGCNKCLIKQTGDLGNSSSRVKQEQCLGQICTEGLAAVNTTISSCFGNFDFLGQQCSCCVTTNVHARFCSTNSDILSNEQILKLLKSQLTIKSLLVFIIIILGLLY